MARLSDQDTPSTGIGQRTIGFFADGGPIGSAATDPDGVATLALPPRYGKGRHTLDARFQGDDYYLGSSASIRT